MNKNDSLSTSSAKRHESFTLSGYSVHLEKSAVIGDELAKAISTPSLVDRGGKVMRETCICIVEIDGRAVCANVPRYNSFTRRTVTPSAMR